MVLILTASSGCKNNADKSRGSNHQPRREDSRTAVPNRDHRNQDPWIIAFRSMPNNHADSFQFPVGNGNPPRGYYNAQGFGENDHLGDDWNGTGGGNSDLGDPIYAIGNGFVRRADQLGPGWGNVVRVVHLQLEPDSHYIESIYAHLDKMLVKEGD